MKSENMLNGVGVAAASHISVEQMMCLLKV